MPIERFVLDALRRPESPETSALCLQCPDCAGTCWSILELDRLPEWVLHPRNPRA